MTKPHLHEQASAGPTYAHVNCPALPNIHLIIKKPNLPSQGGVLGKIKIFSIGCFP